MAYKMIVVLALLALLAVSSTAADSRESEWRMRLQACDDFMEQHGGQQRECTSQPSQRCCQNLQRISSEDRCRALQQVYGGGRHMYPNSGRESPYESQQERTTRMASRLLQQCDLRPRECRTRDAETWLWW
ncbi:hypothetical protein GOP47_0008549 [Adiantum capillus-veneris]|uniref:Bifunctional inhibitor/plant lipid transfer protein/seed storage helical domain-containing protein n=1 Tax=Adiantum capillus-veneris TaxID=13818 RepID=A0A9D4UYX2_ADICA|nr:hypothetical protein GOP47_0008549 [Adiantum capillus-veneris]